MRLSLRVLCLFGFELLLLLLKLCAGEEADGDSGTDDAYHAERVSASVT